MLLTFHILLKFQLHCRVHGGSTDTSLSKVHANTATMQKCIMIYDEMLGAFKSAGHCVTMDSAYMGNIMAQVDYKVWQVNMVGTTQSNWTSANVTEVKDNMTIGTHEYIFSSNKR